MAQLHQLSDDPRIAPPLILKRHPSGQRTNRVLREQLGHRRLRFTDNQRRQLAAKGKAIGRQVLRELGTIVTPDTIFRWYRRLVAKKYNGSEKRRPGQPASHEDFHG